MRMNIKQPTPQLRKSMGWGAGGWCVSKYGILDTMRAAQPKFYPPLSAFLCFCEKERSKNTEESWDPFRNYLQTFLSFTEPGSVRSGLSPKALRDFWKTEHQPLRRWRLSVSPRGLPSLSYWFKDTLIWTVHQTLYVSNFGLTPGLCVLATA